MGLSLALIDDDKSVFNVFRVALNPSIKIDYFENLDCDILFEKYDLIICDLLLGKTSSLDYIIDYKINNKLNMNKLIIMTGQGDLDDEIESHNLGVRDFIHKPLNFKLLKAVIEKHLFNLSSEASSESDFGPFKILHHDLQVVLTENGKEIYLETTLKEFKLLCLLLESKERVLTREYILQQVWDSNSETLTRTLDMHISSLRKKLNTYSQSIRTVRGIGYQLII